MTQVSRLFLLLCFPLFMKPVSAFFRDPLSSCRIRLVGCYGSSRNTVKCDKSYLGKQFLLNFNLHEKKKKQTNIKVKHITLARQKGFEFLYISSKTEHITEESVNRETAPSLSSLDLLLALVGHWIKRNGSL